MNYELFVMIYEFTMQTIKKNTGISRLYKLIICSGSKINLSYGSQENRTHDLRVISTAL